MLHQAKLAPGFEDNRRLHNQNNRRADQAIQQKNKAQNEPRHKLYSSNSPHPPNDFMTENETISTYSDKGVCQNPRNNHPKSSSKMRKK